MIEEEPSGKEELAEAPKSIVKEAAEAIEKQIDEVTYTIAANVAEVQPEGYVLATSEAVEELVIAEETNVGEDENLKTNEANEQEIVAALVDQREENQEKPYIQVEGEKTEEVEEKAGQDSSFEEFARKFAEGEEKEDTIEQDKDT